MSKKLTHLIAICLSFLMMATVLPNIRFGKASIPVAYAEEIDEDIDDYPDDEEEEDLRQFEYIDKIFDEARIEADEETGDVRFEADSEIFGYHKYVCSFDADNLSFEFTYDYGMSIFSNTTVSGYGELNVEIIDESGTSYYTNAYREDSAFADLLEWVLEEKEGLPDVVVKEEGIEVYSLTGLFAIISIIVVTYIIVAETAEQIRAKSNYEYNQNLESQGKGPRGYIDEQWDYPDFRYGFADNFGKVGCGVVAVYNLLLSLNKGTSLSEVIYNFERWGIEVSVAWGNWGSNPRDMYRYFKKEGIRYRRCLSLNQFIKYTNRSKNDNFIMASWNEDNIFGGMHIVYVQRTITNSFTEFYAYNNAGDSIRNDIRDYTSSIRFFCGYIIYE